MLLCPNQKVKLRIEKKGASGRKRVYVPEILATSAYRRIKVFLAPSWPRPFLELLKVYYLYR